MLKTGSWVPVFYVMIACDILAAFMALVWLKPVAARTIAAAEAMERAEAEKVVCSRPFPAEEVCRD